MLCQWQSAPGVASNAKHSLTEAGHIQGRIDRFKPMCGNSLTGQPVTKQQATSHDQSCNT